MRGRWERPKRASPALFRDSGDGSEATPDMVETTSGLGRRPALRARGVERGGGLGVSQELQIAGRESFFHKINEMYMDM